jgi:hypothetical protein
MSKRARFEKLLQEKAETIAAYEATQAEITSEYVADLRLLYKGLHPYAKKLDTRDEYWLRDHLPEDDFTAVLNAYRPRVDAWHERRKSALKNADAQIDMLAKHLEPEAGDNRLSVHWIYSGAYSSQGLGAATYTRKAAERHAMNIPAHIKTDIDYNTPGVTVYAHVKSETDVEIIKRKPVDIRDQVKWCHKNGVSPRVYWPFLPHGYEEEVGLDHFGNDVEVKS